MKYDYPIFITAVEALGYIKLEGDSLMFYKEDEEQGFSNIIYPCSIDYVKEIETKAYQPLTLDFLLAISTMYKTRTMYLKQAIREATLDFYYTLRDKDSYYKFKYFATWKQ
jgi:hypothetical protein